MSLQVSDAHRTQAAFANTSPPAEEGCVWPILKGRLDEPFPSEDEQELDTLPGPESDNAEAEQDTVPVILGSESTNIATSTTARPRVDLQDGSTTDNPHRVPLREPLPEPTNPVPINEDAFLLDAAPTQSGQLCRTRDMAEMHACICGTIIDKDEGEMEKNTT
ncbi:hypothetical protein AX14_004850, partial [Amanita brunnescens Koide BX004]